MSCWRRISAFSRFEGEARGHQGRPIHRHRRLAGKDGKLYAEEVLVFPEAARGTGEGHYGWDLTGKDDTMTNATISQIEVAGVSQDGRTACCAQIQGWRAARSWSARHPVVTFAPDSKDLLKRGRMCSSAPR